MNEKEEKEKALVTLDSELLELDITISKAQIAIDCLVSDFFIYRSGGKYDQEILEQYNKYSSCARIVQDYLIKAKEQFVALGGI